jgi:hypothetical protein
MSNEFFMVGDVVYYTGTKFRDRLNGKKGWLHAPVENEPGVWVCEFPDTKNGKDRTDSDDYVMSTRVLTKHHTTVAVEKSEKKQEGPEVQPRRRKRDPEEE